MDQALQALTHFSKQLAKSEPSTKALRDAVALIYNARKIGFDEGSSAGQILMEIEKKVYQKIISSTRAESSAIDTWHCAASLGSSAPEYVEQLGFHTIEWPFKEMRLSETGGIRFEGEDALLLMAASKQTKKCDAKGCTTVSSNVRTAPGRQSPNGKLAIGSVAAQPDKVSLVLYEKRFINSSNKELVSELPTAPCGVLDPFEVSFDNKDDGDGIVFPTYSHLPSDGFINTCGDTCCHTDSFMRGGLGAMGWLDNESILYAAGGEFFRLAISKKMRTATPIKVSDIPDHLLPYVGVTADRKYRFFFDKQLDSASIWRIDLETKETRLLFNASGKSHIAKWGIGQKMVDDTARQSTWPIPSQNSRRLVVVVAGAIVSLLEIRS